MKAFFLSKTTIIVLVILSAVGWQCSTDEVEPVDQDHEGLTNTPATDTDAPRFSGNLSGLFVGNSSINDVVAEYVARLAEIRDAHNILETEVVLGTDISLRGKMGMEPIREVLARGNTHDYDFAVITDQWDMQIYNVDTDGVDTNDEVNGCPPADYEVPQQWLSDEWVPVPYFVQLYRDGIKCGNPAAYTFYYQTWSLGYNEVREGATRHADQNYQRPSIEEIQEAIRTGNGNPDLPLADRIEFEGVKWQNFIRHANRSDIIFIPAGFALARFMREIEAGEVPGFEAVAATNGKDESGQLVWTNYLFYEDEYHLSTVGNYLMSLVIYATVFNESPAGIEIGSGNFGASEFFPNDQYPLVEITNEAYLNMLNQHNADGIWELRGINNLDYMHEDLRTYLQELVWEVVQSDSNY